MRAVVIFRPGGPEVLEVGEREVRAPAAGEVRIAVHAAAVNPTDVILRERGVPDLEPPWTPGMDAVGTVVAVGSGVDRLTVGQPVIAAVDPRRPEGGAQAQEIVVPQGAVVETPNGVAGDSLATLPMNGLAAQSGLDLLGLTTGATLAVSGGGGFLASLVIPLARRRGIRVLADAAPADAERVRGLGADVVLPRSDDFAARVRGEIADGADGVFDTAALNESALAAVRDGGALVSVRFWSPEVPVRGIAVRPVSAAAVLERADWLQELCDVVQSGAITLREVRRYRPEQAPEAHRALVGGGPRPVIAFR